MSALERQALIRDNWKFSFFEPNQSERDQVYAYVWATGKDTTVEEIQNQVDDTEVWVNSEHEDTNPTE